MAPQEKRDWGEWGRYTLSAVAGAIVTIIYATLNFSDVKHSAADSQAANVVQDAKIERLTSIASDTTSAVVRLTTLMESALPDHAARIRALESRIGGK